MLPTIIMIDSSWSSLSEELSSVEIFNASAHQYHAYHQLICSGVGSSIPIIIDALFLFCDHSSFFIASY